MAKVSAKKGKSNKKNTKNMSAQQKKLVLLVLSGVIFTTFILFHLFNAFNCRELGAQSIFKGIAKNKIMLLTFGTVFLLHIIIVQAYANLVSVNALSFISWVKCAGVSFSIVAVSEVYKAFYRIVSAQICKNKKTFVD